MKDTQIETSEPGTFVSSGSETLDRILRGGIPKQRSVLVSGGPGVGKSTLGMQFLQAGLENDEACLYISTEQTEEKVRWAFREFDFEMDHPNLTITSIHATDAPTAGSDDTQLALRNLEGDEIIGRGYSVPFESEFIQESLMEHSGADRVLFDSASGLAVIDENPYLVRRAVLDLIHLFTDQFGSTAILTAERTGNGRKNKGPLIESLEYATHGVVRLWREEVRGHERRFLKIIKMRGVDHDTRSYEFGISNQGVFLTPENWNHQFEFGDQQVTPTGVNGLDAICGGGLVRGKPVLLEHDGRAPVDALVVSMSAGAFAADMGVWLVPSPVLSAERFNSLLPDPALSVPYLLDEGMLFVLDVFNAWEDVGDHPNVFQFSTSGLVPKLIKKSRLGQRFARRVLRKIDDRRDRPVLAPTFTEAFLHLFGDPMQIRNLYYWALENVTVEEDTAFYVHNPATMDPKLAEFFSYDASQAFETWKSPAGMQYLLLDKSPIGEPGTLAVVEYDDEPPYVHVTKTVG